MQPLIPGSDLFVSRPVDPDVLRRTVAGLLPLHTVTRDQVDALDPLTYEVVRHRLWSVTDEMGEALKRMSGSPIVTDANDFDFTINDEVGQEVQVGLYNTMLVGAIDLAIYWTLQHRADNPGIHDGDMFLCNDPWIGGGLHQSDAVVFQPLFFDGKLFGWTSAISHEADLGGPGLGSMPVNAQDVFAEAAPTPPIKVVRDFEIQRDVHDAWIRRSRVPLLVALDLRAKVGANRVGRDRMLSVIGQYGPDTVKAVMYRMMNDAEQRLRDKLRRLPDGTWRATGYQDQATAGDRRTHKIQLAMTKQDDRLIFDFTGTDPQTGVINCTYGGSRGGIMLALLPTLAHDIPWAAGGLMRCFDIVTDEGTMNNAAFPAAVNRAPIGPAWQIGTLSAQCLSQLLGRDVDFADKVQAGCCGTWNTAVIAGLDERGEFPVPFLDVVMESMAGGFGGRPGADGVDTGGLFCIPMGRTPDAELTELFYPMLMLWRREEPDTGGPGRQRGGVSASVALTPWGTSVPSGLIMASSGKATAQNQGLAGGYPGNLGYDVVVRGSAVAQDLAGGAVPTTIAGLAGQVELGQCFAESYLAPGDVLVLNCQGGGGYGDPLRRDPDAVAGDVAHGRVSPKAAADLYGVVLDDNGRVEVSSTAARRDWLRQQRSAGATLPERQLGVVDLDDTIRADDNLVLVGEDTVACGHCGQQLTDDDGHLQAARLDRSTAELGPVQRAEPGDYIDAEIVLRQICCPGCWTALLTEVVPVDHESLLAGGLSAR